MTEAELLAEVTARCDRLGLLWHHDPDSRFVKGTPGFPDLVVLGSAVGFAELKSEHGDTSPEQDLWIWMLDRAGALWAKLLPSDLENGRIDRFLWAIASK